MLQGIVILEIYEGISEKTGWTCIAISPEQAAKIKPDTRKSFRVKGTIDHLKIAQAAIVPVGEGHYILPINVEMRRALRKEAPAEVHISFELDESEILISEDLMACLSDDTQALAQFERLSRANQRYYSKWIEQAKTLETKSRRIAATIKGLNQGWDYGTTMRNAKK
jgi:Domain of unknown function (DUF1905)/Bacteriocin-protection, YdeI or OmpD-Associated